MEKELIIRYYLAGLYTSTDLQVFVDASYITQTEKEEIDGLEAKV